MRDHQPIIIEQFEGLFKRGSNDSCPIDHFTDCNNIQFTESGFRTRDGLEVFLPYANVLRIYAFNQSLLILDSGGNIYHSARASPTTPILTIGSMIDFVFAKYADRAYISPIGLTNSAIYVYKYGSATNARKAAGDKPTGPPTLANSATAGNIEAGIHIFAVIYETNTGFLTSPGTGAAITCPGEKKVDLSSIPVSGDSFVVARHIIATAAIDPDIYTGNLLGYQFFFVPDGKISNNTATTLSVSFFDAELLNDASHLFDLFSEIPNCTGLNVINNRLFAWAFPQSDAGISQVYVSNAGEPEAFNQIDGLIQIVPDGTPITNVRMYRDISYIFKQTKTIAVTDNGDVPATWPQVVIDHGIGAGSNHAVATIMDSGGVNIDWLMVANYGGISIFNGVYQYPELTWKIRDIWPGDDRQNFGRLQLVINVIKHLIYVVLPNGNMLIGDYQNGLDPTKIRWSPWSFDVEVTSLIVLQDFADVKTIIGSQTLAGGAPPTFIQTAESDSGANDVVSISVTLNVTAGNFLFIAIGANSGALGLPPTFIPLSSNRGDTFVYVIRSAGVGTNPQLYYVESAAGGSTTITFAALNTSGVSFADRLVMVVSEFTPMPSNAGLENSHGSSQTSTTSASLGSIATQLGILFAVDYVYAVVGDAALPIPSGFTNLYNLDQQSGFYARQFSVNYKSISGSSTVNPAWTPVVVGRSHYMAGYSYGRSLAIGSGIYYLKPNKLYDTYYTNVSIPTMVDVKIP